MPSYANIQKKEKNKILGRSEKEMVLVLANRTCVPCNFVGVTEFGIDLTTLWFLQSISWLVTAIFLLYVCMLIWLGSMPGSAFSC